jgi:hypothetical protein
MTKLLEQAFRKASELDPAEQDRLAQGILAELEEEARWEKTFASPESQNMLSLMARKALADLDVGRGVQGTPDEL